MTTTSESKMAATDAMRAEVAAETTNPDGSIVVPLTTRYGSANITVPPANQWGSRARHALWYGDDDWTWATRTLAPGDVQKWADLDPNLDDVKAFFDAWGTKVGQSLGESVASRGSSAPTPGK